MRAPPFLIIDDERNFRELLGEALQAEGYEVRHAGTARAGLALAREALPRVVLLDQNLPDRNGLELIPELRRNPVCPVVIVITAHARLGAAVDAVKAGAFHYLSKPFAFSDLLAVLAQASVTMAEGERAVAPEPCAVSAIVGDAPAMQSMRRDVMRVARSPVATVLVRGQSGTGKELVAHAVHDGSPRRAKRMVAVNCAALADTLLMSELFGHERGAFTDAHQQKRGVFELADGGTLFLDEVSEMGARAQAALLRALEQRTIVRVGGSVEIAVDVRVVAATNRDLAQQVAAGHFRADLYHRLNVVSLELPPLRERGNDVLLLADHLARQIAERYAEPVRTLTAPAQAVLQAYDWPGNVRELRNAIERAYVIGDGPMIDVDDLPSEVTGTDRAASIADAPPSSGSDSSVHSFQDAKRHVVGDFEREYLYAALKSAGGNVTLAAERAGMLRQVFQRMLLRHGIDHGAFREVPRGRGRRSG